MITEMQSPIVGVWVPFSIPKEQVLCRSHFCVLSEDVTHNATLTFLGGQSGVFRCGAKSLC